MKRRPFDEVRRSNQARWAARRSASPQADAQVERRSGASACAYSCRRRKGSGCCRRCRRSAHPGKHSTCRRSNCRRKAGARTGPRLAVFTLYQLSVSPEILHANGAHSGCQRLSRRGSIVRIKRFVADAAQDQVVRAHVLATEVDVHQRTIRIPRLRRDVVVPGEIRPGPDDLAGRRHDRRARLACDPDDARAKWLDDDALSIRGPRRHGLRDHDVRIGDCKKPVLGDDRKRPEVELRRPRARHTERRNGEKSN